MLLHECRPVITAFVKLSVGSSKELTDVFHLHSNSFFSLSSTADEFLRTESTVAGSNVDMPVRESGCRIGIGGMGFTSLKAQNAQYTTTTGSTLSVESTEVSM